jgi:hypothetical protein
MARVLALRGMTMPGRSREQHGIAGGCYDSAFIAMGGFNRSFVSDDEQNG